MENQATDVVNETKETTQTEARETTVPDKLMQRLLNFEPTPAPVISLYLDARVNETGQRGLCENHSLSGNAVAG
jgi:hypothetical protein